MSTPAERRRDKKLTIERRKQERKNQINTIQGWTNTRIGVDVGGVIVEFIALGEQYLKALPFKNAFENLRLLITTYGAENVFIVSKAKQEMEAKTLNWFKHVDIYGQTGLLHANINFCLQYDDKAEICERLKITHFIDDRVQVLKCLSPKVVHKILFQPTGLLDDCNNRPRSSNDYSDNDGSNPSTNISCNNSNDKQGSWVSVASWDDFLTILPSLTI